MKKYRFFVAAAVLVSMLAGCGSGGSKGEGPDSGGIRNNADNAGGAGYTSKDMDGGYDQSMGIMAESPAEMYWNTAEDMAAEPGWETGEDWNTEEYSALEEPGFKSVKSSPVSTFSADVDTASYTNLRRMIEANYSIGDIPAGSVRIEELLNYFKYDYRLPDKGEPFGVTTVMGDCPWNRDAKLLQIGLKTEPIDFSEAPSSNLVFLLDVSGSMYSDDKLPLLQAAFTMLVEELTEKDRVSIVTYAGSDQVLLSGEKGSSHAEIAEIINNLSAGGSTNGAAGIETAYRLAEENFIEGGNNRIILATDGDLNVGVSSESDLKSLVEKKRESGIYLSVLGFGTGDLKDNKMETLADNGNGNYSYIDSKGEAKRVMVEEMGATLVTVAKDVKLQIEFNPAYIKGYRLLGYENRMLATEDFEDDTKDAGEIGAGHTVTALYEIITADSDFEIPETELKYQEVTPGVENGEWATLKIRYKEPEKEESVLKEYTVTKAAYTARPGGDFNFAAAVAELGLLVRDSKYKGEASFRNIEELLRKADTDHDDYRDEFAYLVKKLKRNSPAEKAEAIGKSTDKDPQAAGDGNGGSAGAELCGYPLAPQTQGEKVTCQWQNLTIGMEIPAGWEYAVKEYSDDDRKFGICFWPEGCSGQVALYYYEMFGVCGTGLEEKDITFESGRTGRMGIYDGGDTFSFITFPEQELSTGYFVAINEDGGAWLAEHEDEVLSMLGAAVMKKE